MASLTGKGNPEQGETEVGGLGQGCVVKVQESAGKSMQSAPAGQVTGTFSIGFHPHWWRVARECTLPVPSSPLQSLFGVRGEHTEGVKADMEECL